ncbi:hypothetical protein TNCV_603981 [Trichonephila clavipes]|nr:hypothetical protein TNCV_603981 [Trichonephila clavipes]
MLNHNLVTIPKLATPLQTTPRQPEVFQLRQIRRSSAPLHGSFSMRGKGGNRLVPGPDYMVDVLKLPNQALKVSGESLQTCVTWRCPDGSQRLFGWLILAVYGQSLASNGPVVDSRDLNLVFSHTELLGDTTTSNMPVNLDYFCDFIDIFDDEPVYARPGPITIHHHYSFSQKVAVVRAGLHNYANDVKKILQFKVPGIWKRGRSRLRWTDSVELDFRIINEKTWRRRMLLWKKLQWKALAHEDLAGYDDDLVDFNQHCSKVTLRTIGNELLLERHSDDYKNIRDDISLP